MRYISVCSGIEAATVAWHGLGWTPVAFSEIEPFPSAVLKHHYPNVPSLGDMIESIIRSWRYIRARRRTDWRRLPRPNWACCRGGVEVW